jgi:hypothetical protein
MMESKSKQRIRKLWYIFNPERACNISLYFTLNCVVNIIPLNIVKKSMQMCKHVGRHPEILWGNTYPNILQAL